jgi:hypothetical protein
MPQDRRGVQRVYAGNKNKINQKYTLRPNFKTLSAEGRFCRVSKVPKSRREGFVAVRKFFLK